MFGPHAYTYTHTHFSLVSSSDGKGAAAASASLSLVGALATAKKTKAGATRHAFTGKPGGRGAAPAGQQAPAMGGRQAQQLRLRLHEGGLEGAGLEGRHKLAR